MSGHKYLLIALGGGLGSVARFWVASAVAQRFGARFHYGTLAVNLSACAIMGFSLALLGRREADWGLAWSFLIPIGFVGAYSTFSTFEWDGFVDLQAGAFLRAGMYVSLSVFLGFAAVWLGISAAKLVR